MARTQLASHIDLSDPFREWARDGLAFLKHGISGESSKKRRFGVDLSKVLRSEDASTGAEALEEVRAVADWMRHRKALTDLRYRVDFLAKDGTEYDLATLAEELIARHKGMSTFRDVYSGAKGEKKEEDVVGWAWWADAEVLDTPGDVQVVRIQSLSAVLELMKVQDWIARKKEVKAEKRKKKKKQRRPPAEGEAVEEFSNRFLPTPPRLNATRRFLDAYVEQISGPLEAARPPNRK